MIYICRCGNYWPDQPYRAAGQRPRTCDECIRKAGKPTLKTILAYKQRANNHQEVNHVGPHSHSNRRQGSRQR